MKFPLTLLLALLFAVPAYAQLGSQAGPGPVPTSALTQISPNASTSPYSLGQLNSPTNYQVPRGHLRVWKPFTQPQGIDSTGSTFNGKTATVTLEIPSDATMAQVVFANFGANSYTISNAAIWGSSELENTPTNGLGGVSLFDASGNALSSMALLSFGNNGVDSIPSVAPNTAPGNAQSLVTSGSSTGVTLNFTASFSCPNLGSTALILSSTSSNNPLLYPNETVTACNSGAGTITISANGISGTVPSGTTVYFLPPNFVVPASAAAPLPSLTFSDWVPITTYSRIDGPIQSAMTVLVGGQPLSGTVSSTTATTATMSANISSPIVSGTPIQACRAVTTNAAITPNYSIQFATASGLASSIAIGMSVSPPGLATQIRNDFWPLTTVLAVSSAGGNTTVTLSGLQVVNGATSIGSGTSFALFQSATTAAPTSTSSAVLTLQSVANLAVGMSVYGGTSTSPIGGTIQSINSGTSQVTMTQNVTSAIPSGQPIRFTFTVATNAAANIATGISPSAVATGIVPGMQIISGAAFPANAYTTSYSGFLPVSTIQPTSTIASGSTVYFCYPPIKTTLAASSGQPTLTFSSTRWLNRLVSLRANISGSNANFTTVSSGVYGLWPNLPGNPQSFTAATCTSEGVLNISGISNTAGGCSQSAAYLPYMIKFYSPTRGVTIAFVGDSHQAASTIQDSAGYAAQAAYLLSNPSTLPISPMDVGWPGASSTAYGSLGMQLVKSVQPEIVFIQYTTPNDDTSLASVASMSGIANSIASYVRSYGGLPILVPDYQRQLYGCTAASVPQEAIRLNGESVLASAAQAGEITLDLPTFLADPINGANWLNPLYTNECIHANTAGHAAIAAGAVNLLKPLLRY